MAEDDDCPVVRGKRRECGHGLGVEVVRRRLRARRRHGELLVSDFPPEGPCARPVDRPVHDDPVQPGPEGPPAVEAVECANRGEERFLDDVLGRGGVVDDEVGGAVGAGPVVPEKGLEVRGRSGLGGTHPGAFLAARSCHGVPTIRACARKKSIRRRTRAPVCKVHTIPHMDALLVVDFQNDFTPGGALPVAEGDRIAGPINALLDGFDLVIATRDCHCADHGSFAGVEVDPAQWRGADPPSIWPVHCVEGTPGAELHPSLDQEKVDLVLDKGHDRNSQGYSAFQDTRLGDLLRERGVDRIFVAGLATDYCVKNSVLDARREGFDVTVVENAVRGVEVEPGDSERALAEMEDAGAHLATSDEILAERT
jgi:nicotinamidase/pyrazinamidase